MCSNFPLSAIPCRLVFLLAIAIVVRGIEAECTSNQDCINLGNQNARYGDWFCWKDSTCNSYPQLVMLYTSKNPPGSDTNGKKSPYPVFKNGQEMCVTVMIDPSIVYTDRLWEGIYTTINRTHRLDVLKHLPLKLDIKTLRMCTSLVENNVGEYGSDIQNDGNQVTYVRNTHVRHFDASEPESTGCNSEGNGNVVTETLYDRNKASKRKGKIVDKDMKGKVATLGHSDNALSSTVCFQTKVLGPSHIPTYVEARVDITRIKSNKEMRENSRILNSLGLYSSSSSHVSVTVTSSDSMAATSRWRERMLADVDKQHISDHYDTMLGQNRKRDLTPEEIEDIDCDGNRDYTLDHNFGLPPDVHQKYHDYCTSEKQRHSGYYYYGYDDSYYYYYHPHVVCDYDLEFRGTAGVCEQEGSLKGETGLHVFILFINNIVGIIAIISFCFDYRSGVLFI